MSRGRNSPVPLIKYDFNRATDRRHEKRYEPIDELFFRDAPQGNKIRTCFVDNMRDKN